MRTVRDVQGQLPGIGAAWDFSCSVLPSMLAVVSLSTPSIVTAMKGDRSWLVDCDKRLRLV